MKLIIAGSRWIKDKRHLRDAFSFTGWDWEVTEVVCGMAAGADTLGKEWAEKNGIPVKPFPAAWRDKDGSFDRSAGFKRNELMAQYADALLALWDGESSGTADMIKRARKHGLKIHVLVVKE